MVLMNPAETYLSGPVTSQVLSAQESLTAVFEMGTGVTSLSYPPEV